MADGVNVFHFAFRKKDSEFHFVIRSLTYCSIDCFQPFRSIFRMNALQTLFPYRSALIRLESVDAIPFLRKMQGLSSRYLPHPAAGMRQPLRLRQVGLASSQALVCTLTFGCIDHSAHILHDIAGWTKNRMPHDVDVSHLAVQTNDSAIQFVANFCEDRRLYNVGVSFSIQRMNALNALLPRWHNLVLSDAVDATPFLRHMKEIFRSGAPCPTSHMA